MRYAIYHTPEPGDPLLRAAEGWLGRSAFGTEVPPGEAAERSLVADARRYGFHATLEAPFALADGRSEGKLHKALARCAAARAPVENVWLHLAQPSGFFTLVPDDGYAELDTLAADLVRDFDAFRAPLSNEDLARRAPAALSERQRAHLGRWGYSYVFEEFAFHMTLTGRLDARASAAVRPVLEKRFAALLAAPRTVRTVALFSERLRGEDFAA